MMDIGFVFSGGAFRTVAQIGVIKYLEEINLVPQYISGASGGAIIGALYAAGNNSETMLGIFKTTSIFRLSNYALRKPGLIDLSKFEKVLLKYIPENTFESLKKKLFITATDLLTGKSKIFHKGSVVRPVLASSAVPFVFAPVEIEGQIYADGGILNNFPVEPLEGLCDRIIGVHVNPIKLLSKKDLQNIFSVAERGFQLSIHAASTYKFSKCDLVIEPEEVAAYGILDFKGTDRIFEIGYNEAKKHADWFDVLLQNQGK